jgi:hypothetical protein
VAYKYGQAIRLVSRAGTDHTKRFPGLVAAFQTLPAFSLILDGKVYRFDERLVSRFEWLRRRPNDETATPPVFVAFDCLYAHRQDLRDRPLRVRRHVLEAEVASEHFVLSARHLDDDGLARNIVPSAHSARQWASGTDCSLISVLASLPLRPARVHGVRGEAHRLVNHLIRPLQERRRDRHAEGLGGLRLMTK